MNVSCQFCSALYWLQERVSTSSRQNPRFKNCCKQGAIVLEAPRNVPEFFSTLFQADNLLSKHFGVETLPKEAWLALVWSSA